MGSPLLPYNLPPALVSDPQITIVILTFNEARHIRRCIERAAGIGRRIVVIDSASTDGTQAIARELGAEVYERRFTYHADQLNWGLRAAKVIEGWVLRLDADEYLQPALADEIRDRLPTMPADVSSIEFKLRLIFKKRWIRWGGYYDTVLVRLWKIGVAGVEDKLMDERVSVWEGRTVRFTRGDLVDENLNDIAVWTAKHNNYSTKHMVQFIRAELGLTSPGAVQGKLTNQGARKRFLRDELYSSAPLYLRCVLYFFYRYFLRLGFLDGTQGFVWHVLQGFWHMMLIDVKIEEARYIIAQYGASELDRELRENYGLTLFPGTPDNQLTEGSRSLGMNKAL